jgi:hypothetical protein
VLDYSAGLACLSAVDVALGDFQQRSGAALYKAKNEGRGRLVETVTKEVTKGVTHSAIACLNACMRAHRRRDALCVSARVLIRL